MHMRDALDAEANDDARNYAHHGQLEWIDEDDLFRVSTENSVDG